MARKSVFPYWLLFASFAFPALVERVRPPHDHRITPAMVALFLMMTAMIGLRFQVGGDYEVYIRIFENASSASLGQALERGDPGYQFINWLVGQWDGKLWHVNLICGAIFSWGLCRFCQRQPAPMLSALVAIPYLVIVVAMGYSRQAVAIGAIMAGFAALDRNGSIPRFVAYVALAALFHRTAVIVLPMAIFASRRNHLLNVMALAVGAYGLYAALLEESVGGLVSSYIDTRYASQGATVRVGMNLLPALLLIFAGRRLDLSDYQIRLWRIVALAALACVPALVVVPSTTAVDRIALYLIPIQIVAIGRLSILLRSQTCGALFVILYSFAVQFVWLNFAVHAQYWVPYRTVF